jgi:hypothetical protein
MKVDKHWDDLNEEGMGNRRVEHGGLLKALGVGAILAILLIGATLLRLRGTHRFSAPKRIEADGITYVACLGVLWLPNNQQSERSNQPQTYEVRFRDARGVDHELHMVRMLRISNLPIDTPECTNPL